MLSLPESAQRIASRLHESILCVINCSKLHKLPCGHDFRFFIYFKFYAKNVTHCSEFFCFFSCPTLNFRFCFIICFSRNFECSLFADPPISFFDFSRSVSLIAERLRELWCSILKKTSLTVKIGQAFRLSLP